MEKSIVSNIKAQCYPAECSVFGDMETMPLHKEMVWALSHWVGGLFLC